jgi:hypothetical protein
MWSHHFHAGNTKNAMPSCDVYAVVSICSEWEDGMESVGNHRNYPGNSPMPHRDMAQTFLDHQVCDNTSCSESSAPHDVHTPCNQVHERLLNVVVAAYATEEAAQADAAARRAAADAKGEDEMVAWDVNKFTLTKAVAPGDVVYCVYNGDASLACIIEASMFVTKAEAQALLEETQQQEWAVRVYTCAAHTCPSACPPASTRP